MDDTIVDRAFYFYEKGRPLYDTISQLGDECCHTLVKVECIGNLPRPLLEFGLLLKSKGRLDLWDYIRKVQDKFTGVHPIVLFSILASREEYDNEIILRYVYKEYDRGAIRLSLKCALRFSKERFRRVIGYYVKHGIDHVELLKYISIPIYELKQYELMINIAGSVIYSEENVSDAVWYFRMFNELLDLCPLSISQIMVQTSSKRLRGQLAYIVDSQV